MGFGLGLVKGIATSVNRNLMQSMEDYKDKIDLLTATNVKTAQQREADYNERMTSVTGSLGDIKRAVDGDLGVVQYLVDEYGLEGAKEKADLINSLSKKTGKVRKASEIVGLVRDPNNTITLDSLAKSLIPAPSQIYTDAKIEPTGLMKLFDDDISDNVRKETEEMLGAAGIRSSYGEMKRLDPVYTDKTTGIREWELYVPDDFGEAEAYLRRVESELREKGIFENDSTLIDDANAVKTERNFVDIMRQIKEGGREEMSDTLLGKTRYAIMAKLSMNWLGVEERKQLFQNGIFTPSLIGQVQGSILNAEAARIMVQINAAKKAGVSATEINFMVDMAINMNRAITFVETEDNRYGGRSMAMGLPDGKLEFVKNTNNEFIPAIVPTALRGKRDPKRFFEPIFPSNKFITPDLEEGLLNIIEDKEVVALFRKYKAEGKLKETTEIENLKVDLRKLQTDGKQRYKDTQIENLFKSISFGKK